MTTPCSTCELYCFIVLYGIGAGVWLLGKWVPANFDDANLGGRAPLVPVIFFCYANNQALCEIIKSHGDGVAFIKVYGHQYSFLRLARLRACMNSS